MAKANDFEQVVKASWKKFEESMNKYFGYKCTHSTSGYPYYEDESNVYSFEILVGTKNAWVFDMLNKPYVLNDATGYFEHPSVRHGWRGGCSYENKEDGIIYNISYRQFGHKGVTIVNVRIEHMPQIPEKEEYMIEVVDLAKGGKWTAYDGKAYCKTDAYSMVGYLNQQDTEDKYYRYRKIEDEKEN